MLSTNQNQKMKCLANIICCGSAILAVGIGLMSHYAAVMTSEVAGNQKEENHRGSV